MPTMFNPVTGERKSLNDPAKVLCYGEEKTGKTWWALRAASLGFNVTILDGDNSHHVVTQIPEEMQKKIAVVKLLDSKSNAKFHNFLTRIYLNTAWAMREKDGESIYAGSRASYTDTAHGNTPHVFFDPTKLNLNDVLIIDSWSAFCRSMAKSYKIVNSRGNKDLNTIPTGSVKESDIGRQAWTDYGRVKSSTIQPMGYSGPQGKILGQFFTDILRFYINKMDKREISTRPTFDVKAGSRILKPATYAWETLTWEKYFELGKAVYSLPEDTGEYYNSEAFEFLGTEGENRFPRALRKKQVRHGWTLVSVPLQSPRYHWTTLLKINRNSAQ